MEPLPAPQPTDVDVNGTPVRVLERRLDGAPAMLLLHGAWGDAALHWRPVWDALGARFRLVAPELPGFGHGTPPGPRTVKDFAAWTLALLDALGIARTWVVANGFGGGVGWQLAVKAPERVAGLVLLNGGPPPPQPWLLRQFFRLDASRRFVRHALRNGLFGPLAVARGFADPAKAPPALVGLHAAPEPALSTLLETIVRGGATAGAPRVPVMMAWGEADRLPGTDALAMDRLVAIDNTPRYETIPGAGHLPQLEAPGPVVERILAFVAERGAGAPAT